MKVLVVSSKYSPEYSGSGLRAHRSYLRFSKNFGLDFEVICSSTESTKAEKYQVDGIEVERIVSRRMRRINRSLIRTPLRRLSNAVLFHIEARTVKRALRERSFDVIHTFGYSPATATAIRWSRNRDVPLILELVNSGALPYQYLPCGKYFSPYGLRNQSVIVAISQSLGETCRKYGLNENVWVRPNPVDTGRFVIASNSRRIAARQKISSASKTDILIVYIAKFLSRKNHSFLLDVLAKLPAQFRLILGGPPLADRDLVPGLREHEIPKLMEQARALGIDERVEIHPGFVDMSEYLRAADVFCFPAVDEGMGTPILESISAGVPVVANADESSFREWVADGENGFLRSLSSEKWAKAVLQASEFSTAKKLAMSIRIKEVISTDLIDEQYRKILDAVGSANPDHSVNVAEILAN